ncbi:MAG: 50S ribosomal protein L10 [bacterium]|nr:50S ribosomal protein L10 [bacterium]
MALTKQEKQVQLDQLNDLLRSSKLTVAARYRGTGVKQMQELRRNAEAENTTIKVVKNRLVKKAVEGIDALKDVDVSELNGQLMYVFNAEDEVAPAQVVAKFAKESAPNIEFVGAITADGQFMTADDVKALAALPSKDQLRARLVGTIAAPLTGFVNVLSGNLRGVLNVMTARAETIK